MSLDLPNSMLSLVLILTQLISASTNPFFLCVSDDGAICVDFGAAGCACGHHDPSNVGSRERCLGGRSTMSGQVHEHDEDALCVVTTGRSDCDCVHLPITIQSGPAIRPVSSIRLSDVIAAIPAAVGVSCIAPGQSACVSGGCRLEARASVLDALSSVMMSC